MKNEKLRIGHFDLSVEFHCQDEAHFLNYYIIIRKDKELINRRKERKIN